MVEAQEEHLLVQHNREHQVVFQHFLQLHQLVVEEVEDILFQTVKVLVQEVQVVAEGMLVQVQEYVEEQVIHLQLVPLKVMLAELLIELF